MLRIRPDQLAAVSAAKAEVFEDRVIAHLHKCWPGPAIDAGEPALQALVRDGIKRASRYGINTERDVVRFIDVMFMLGPDFATDSRHAWAAPILANSALESRAKMDEIWARTRQTLEAAAEREGVGRA